MKRIQINIFGTIGLLLGISLTIFTLESPSRASDYAEKLKSECSEYYPKFRNNPETINSSDIALGLSKCTEYLNMHTGVIEEPILQSLIALTGLSGDIESSIKFIILGTRIYPENHLYYQSLGDAFYFTSDYEQAIEAYKKALAINPQEYIIYKNLGITQFEAEQNLEAIDTFKKLTVLTPQDPEVFVALGNVYLRLGQYDDAISIFNKAIAVDNDYYLPYMNIGSAYYYIGNYEQSIKYYKKSLSVDPKSVTSYIWLSWAYGEINELDKSLSSLQRALEIQPENFTAIHTLRELERKYFQVKHTKLPIIQEENTQKPDHKYEPILKSIVRIMINDKFPPTNAGTGWIFKKDGNTALILTNRHIVTQDDEINAKPNIEVEVFSLKGDGGFRKRLPARILQKTLPNDPLDLAVLEVENIPSDITPLPFSAKELKNEIPVLMIGHPFNDQPWTIRSGKFNYSESQNSEGSRLVFDIQTAKGNSGGPILNSDLEVIGIISALKAALPQRFEETRNRIGRKAISENMDQVLGQLQKWGL